MDPSGINSPIHGGKLLATVGGAASAGVVSNKGLLVQTVLPGGVAKQPGHVSLMMGKVW